MSKAQTSPVIFDFTALFWRLLRRSVAVVIIASVIAVIVFGACQYLPQRFRAMAVVEIEPPSLLPNYNEALVGMRRNSVDSQALRELAEGEELLAAVYVSVTDDQDNGHEFSKNVTVRALDARRLQLKVVDFDAATATALVNAWAEQLVAAAIVKDDDASAVMTWLSSQAEAAQQRWAAMYQQAVDVGADADAFERERLAADAEVARNIYVSLSQTVEQYKVTEKISDVSINVVETTDPRAQSISFNTTGYVLGAWVFVFVAGCLILLFSELARLDRDQ